MEKILRSAALKIFWQKKKLNEKQYEILMWEKADHMEFSEKIRVLSMRLSRSMKYQSVNISWCFI
ncbi:MAG: hypothetical protein ACLU7M_03420 [Mediterraneibacter gnavus]